MADPNMLVPKFDIHSFLYMYYTYRLHCENVGKNYDWTQKKRQI